MFFGDTENLVGIRVEKRLGKTNFELFRFSSGDEIFSFSDGEKHIFFPDPFYLTLRFFDYPFGGRKAKSAAEIEISSEEIGENEKYVIWTPRKKGTTVALIYDAEEAKKIMERGISSIYFKPSVLLGLKSFYREHIIVEVGNRNLSLAYSDGEKIRLGFFSYVEKDDIRTYTSLFLSQVWDKEKIRFAVCGPKHELFPFDYELIKPSEVFDVEEDDPSFVSLFCLALLKGKFPEIKVGGRKEVSIIPYLSKTLPLSVLASTFLIFISVPSFLEMKMEEQKRDSIVAEMKSIFEQTFPNIKNPVDPYEQMRIEYTKMKADGKNDILSFFLVFSKSISDVVVRIEDFRFEEDEVSAQLKISELSHVEIIRERVNLILQDVKVTSTVRSRDGKFFIMRLTGKPKKGIRLKEMI